MNKAYRKSLNTIMEYFDLGPTVAMTMMLVSGTIILTGIILFINSAPPTELTIASGPKGSIFYGTAQKYAKALEKNGIKVNLVTSRGSLENLKLIADPKNKIDLAMVQSGSEDDKSLLENLVSLGAINNQPLFFFYRGSTIERLTQMRGKNIGISSEGSGGRKLALKILKLNGIEPGPHLQTLEGEAASSALIDKKIDGAFLMGEDASVDVLKKLLLAPDIHLMSFNNANSYIRKIPILHILELPEGVLNFEKNIPDRNITLMGPMVELIATQDLHPALSDIVLDAAMEIHGKAGIFKKRGDFPVAVQNEIKLSEDATRFYKSGKSFLYRYLPFWLASLVNRMLVVFLPMLIVLIPAVRSIPAVFRWMGQLRIRRRYRALLRLEERLQRERSPEQMQTIFEQFEMIEKDIQGMRVRSTLAMQLYTLKSHLNYVKQVMVSRKN